MKSGPYDIYALVTDSFGGRGGIAQYNRDLMSALADSGLLSSLTILPRTAPDCFVLPSGIDQRRARPGRVAYSFAALFTALFKPVDVVFCGHLYMAPLAALIARLKRARLIIQTHGIDAWCRPSRFQRTAVESADLILCVSRYTRANVLGWASVAPERVLVLPNTISEAFVPGGSTLRATWGLEGRRVLLTVGRMDAREQYKGHDRVIRAIPQLVADGHDVVYVVVGEGDDINRLQVLANALRVAERVRFAGPLAKETLVEAYRMADLFVMPSTGEGFGIAFVEAMACGTPALGLSVAGACDALADGELGYTVTEADLPEAIGRYLATPKPDPRALSEAVAARFGWKVFGTLVGEIVSHRFTVRDFS